MKSTVETLDRDRVRLAIEVPFGELDPGLIHDYRLDVAGVRAARIPFQAIDRHAGATVLPTTLEQAILARIAAAAREHDLRLLGRPEVDVTGFGDGLPLTFAAVAQLRPRIVLPELSSILVEVEPVTVADDEIDEQLEYLRQHYPVNDAEPAPLDDKFARVVSEFETLAQLRGHLLEQTARRKRTEQLRAARGQALGQIIAAADVPAPANVVHDEVENRRQWMSDELRRAGTSLAEYLAAAEKTHEDVDDALVRATIERVRGQLVLDAIADAEDIHVAKDEIEKEIAHRAQRAGVSPVAYQEQLAETGTAPALVSDIRRGKALAHLMARITIHGVTTEASMARLGTPQG